MIRTPLLFLAVFLLTMGGAFGQSGASPNPSRDAIQQQIRTRIEAERRGLDALHVGGETIQAARTVTQFYQDGGFDPGWVRERGPTAAVDRLLDALRRADREGLVPGHYHVQAIEALRARSQDSDRTVGELTDLELLCTDAFLLYASHLLSGRTSAVQVTPTWNVPRRQADLLQLLRDVTAGNTTVAAALASVRPAQPEYKALMRALKRYRALAADGGWPTVPDGPKLERGSTGERVIRLRERLAVTNEGRAAPSTGADTAAFDSSLHEAVVRFQERHGLDADGVVGAATLAALNVSAEARAQQLVVNLERWRWMPNDLGERYILVNIADARLRLVENGEEALSMRVVVGQPYRQTPVFSGDISYLVFNPYWHMPHSIATKDKLPEIQRDPGYLQRQQFEVFRGWGEDAQPIDPSSIDWSRLTATTFPYRLRQKPGPYNALGRVKFMFPNPHNVYLHDTPTRGHFARAGRAFSSGCIRLEHPIELAETLLADHPQWGPQRIQSTLQDASAEQAVTLRRRVPVHLQYWTAWADAEGTVHFREDVYQRDDAVRRALTAAPPAH